MTGAIASDTRMRTSAYFGNGHAASVKKDLSDVGSSSGKKEAEWHLAAFSALSREEQASKLPFCVGDNITLEQFHAKCDELESGGCFRWEFANGRVWIYEMPHRAHDAAAGQVVQEICFPLILGGHYRDVITASSPRCDNDDAEWSYQPAGTIIVSDFLPLGPRDPDAADSDGNRWPNVVVEVALTESEPHVKKKALDWLNTAPVNGDNGVQQVIIIKIGATERLGQHRTTKAFRYERGATSKPVQEIEFGHPRDHRAGNGATVAGLPGMQLFIPLSSIYLPLPPPADLASPIVIDLFYIRRIIEKSFRITEIEP